ncbi:tetratricopeptide repeat protein [Streptacidiphilus sp. MAP5-3]|uniref:tetratricopeptide repeat protein n=1 Tax=unclassified Streptacidiphilus TaxID=2643834 RepID=UPI00351367E8
MTSQYDPNDGSSDSTRQWSSVHDHGTSFNQKYGLQIYYSPREPGSVASLEATARREALTDLPLVRDCHDAIEFGVHPAALAGGNRVPAYVRRDIDEDLETLLRPGRFVLLIGDSTAGKSRCAYEILQAQYADFLIHSPENGEEFSEGVLALADQRKVIWLDDLERFLTPPILPSKMLDEALRQKSVILGTIRAEQLNLISPRYATGPNAPNAQLLRNARAVISRAHTIHVERRWSSEEISRASRISDPRIHDALHHSDEVGVAEYLTAGPQLYIDWKSAWAPGVNPRGAALVAAAVDFKRIGVTSPISRAILEEAHSDYLQARGGARLRPEPIEEALHWALQPLHATSSLLTPSEDGDSFEAFDYLVDVMMRDTAAPKPPGSLWEIALNRFSPEVVHTVGHRAEEMKEPLVAKKIYHVIAAAGVDHGSFHLGLLAVQQGNLEEAERWYRTAISQGNRDARNNLAATLLRSDENSTEALELLKSAAADDDFYAIDNLGDLYIRRKNWEAAEELYARAVEKHGAEAKKLMGALLIAQERWDEAWRWLDDAALSGSKEAYFYLGIWHEQNGGVEAAIESYEIAVAAGFLRGINNLGVALAKANRRSEAEGVFRRAIGGSDSMSVAPTKNLAVMLMRDGRHSEAEQLLVTHLEQHPHSDAEVLLGDLLVEQNRIKEALPLLSAAAERNSSMAYLGLARLYRTQGEPRKAIPWIGKALAVRGSEEVTSAQVACEMGLLQENLGEPLRAAFWYKRAIADGSVKAEVCLGYLCERTNRTRQAIKLYKHAMEAGDNHALYHLGQYYLGRGQLKSAIDFLGRAQKAGEDVVMMLAYAYQASGRPKEAMLLVEDAAKSGHKAAADFLKTHTVAEKV